MPQTNLIFFFNVKNKMLRQHKRFKKSKTKLRHESLTRLDLISLAILNNKIKNTMTINNLIKKLTM